MLLVVIVKLLKNQRLMCIMPMVKWPLKKHFLFITANPKLKPGATIFVPEKSANTKKLSAQEVLGITSGISTLGILIKTLLQ
jgi:hypothetical protein